MLEHVCVKSKLKDFLQCARKRPMTRADTIRKNLDAVRDKIAKSAAISGRKADDICLVAVTKTVGMEEAQALYDLKVRYLGENRVQEALRKQGALRRLDLRWHMIGHLQTNKVSKVVTNFFLSHSVDSVRLARALNAAAERAAVVVDILLQINVSGEESKSGFAPESLESALADIVEMKSLCARGLMTMAPLLAEPEQSRPLFIALRELRNRYRQAAPTLEHLSMGMTQDFDIAIEEGADLVRIGAALFREE